MTRKVKPLGVQNQAKIIAILGASGSGKSTAIKQLLKEQKPQRLIVIDPMGEYGDHANHVKTVSDVLAAARQKTFKVAFKTSSVNPVTQFETICRIAYSMGDCWLIVDELAIFTQPNKAPPAWADCSMRGRHRGMTVIGASQRPASIDKHFFGNASIVRAGRLNYADDVKTMANVLNVPPQQIKDLLPLEYVQRDMGNGTITTGKVTF